MKNKNHLLVVITTIAFTFTLISACKKDRIPQDDYQSLDSFYDDNKEEEQEFIIDSAGTNCFITAKKGTRICVPRESLQFSNGTDITYPFTLKVVELYSIKDMILWKIPATAGTSILETSAAVRVRAFKNGTEVFLKPGTSYLLETASFASTNSGMLSYYGFDNGGNNDWTNTLSNILPGFVDTISAVIATPTFYSLTVANTGWISCARLHSSPNATTTLSLTASGTNTQNIHVYISFTSFKGLTKVNNFSSIPIPLATQVTLVAIGKKSNGDFVINQQSFALTANQQVALSMGVISEANLLAALAAL
jgi:hypothetical protein